MELNIYLVGVLVSEARLQAVYPDFLPVKGHSNFNQFQFFLDILNTDDIPVEYQKFFKNRFALGYDNQIRDPEWESISEKQQFFKEEAFKNFAFNKVFIFKPYLDENNYGEKNIKVSKNSLKIIDRPRGISEKAFGSLMTIPIFNEYNQYAFEKRLLSSQAIGNYDFLDRITASCVVSGDYIYGEFQDFEKLNDGWHVSIDGTLRKLPIDFEAYNEHIIIETHAIYVDYDFFNDVILTEGLIKQGNPVSLDKKVKLKEITEEPIGDFEEEQYSEEDFLNTLFDQLNKTGLIFEKKQLVNYHTALKTRRLVILSGPSGTGKTQVVFQYAKALGIVNKDMQQFKMIPVKPNWKDDTDLIGFLDTINNIYRPSESGLVDVLIEAKNNQDKIYLICFDEMNLAKVEYYFSQFLSVLELEGNERKISLYSKKLVGRVLNGEQYPHEISILPNVLFVGTINNDETTQTLSDKVLDRANFIEFNIPENHINNWVNRYNHVSEHSPADSKTDRKVVDLYHYNNWKKGKTEINLLPSEIEILNQLNEVLIKHDNLKGIGFRVLDHINSYMLNLPVNQILGRSDAFDLQISQKIIPKIRGTYDELKEILIEEENSILSILDETTYPISYVAIKRKVRELNLYGYTY
ncbi:McrB family protein [Bacillus sp. UMB0728]|uniref:McrB family protein n=1 Tax=Bacillus sp. UMB0728 TaxID=2066052 RepID=UPI000C7682AE|nr:PhoH family protein [Bacillus sp. UMB0728]PLR71029.1 hypothetical protein CYJ37_19775 [Bacillus sp. UMB0728]